MTAETTCDDPGELRPVEVTRRHVDCDRDVETLGAPLGCLSECGVDDVRREAMHQP